MDIAARIFTFPTLTCAFISQRGDFFFLCCKDGIQFAILKKTVYNLLYLIYKKYK